MDTAEAKIVLASELGKYRLRSYAELRERIGSQDDFTAAASSGKQYQVEVGFLWDGKPENNIRVMGAIDDGGWRAMIPLTESFILSPSGEFIGEDALSEAPPDRVSQNAMMRQFTLRQLLESIAWISLGLSACRAFAWASDPWRFPHKLEPLGAPILLTLWVVIGTAFGNVVATFCGHRLAWSFIGVAWTLFAAIGLSYLGFFTR
jgi:hypothetical protein